MLGYDFKIQYRPSCENKVVDALSYNPSFQGRIKATLATQVIGIERIDQEVTRDEKLQRIIQNLLRNPNSHEDYTLRATCYTKEGQFF